MLRAAFPSARSQRSRCETELRAAAGLPVGAAAAVEPVVRVSMAMPKTCARGNVGEELSRRVALIVRAALVQMLDVFASGVTDEHIRSADRRLPFRRPRARVAVGRKTESDRTRLPGPSLAPQRDRRSRRDLHSDAAETRGPRSSAASVVWMPAMLRIQFERNLSILPIPASAATPRSRRPRTPVRGPAVDCSARENPRERIATD